MSKVLYVVRMERYGDPERHSYNIGIYDCPNKADKAGQEEHQSRAGKYDAVINMFTLNDEDGYPKKNFSFALGRFEFSGSMPRRKTERYFNFYGYKTRSAKTLLVGLWWIVLTFRWNNKV